MTKNNLSRFFVGGTIHICWTVSFVLMNELTVVRMRGRLAGVFSGGWAVGGTALAVATFVLRDWVWLQRLLAALSLLLVAFYFLVWFCNFTNSFSDAVVAVGVAALASVVIIFVGSCVAVDDMIYCIEEEIISARKPPTFRNKTAAKNGIL